MQPQETGRSHRQRRCPCAGLDRARWGLRGGVTAGETRLGVEPPAMRHTKVRSIKHAFRASRLEDGGDIALTKGLVHLHHRLDGRGRLRLCSRRAETHWNGRRGGGVYGQPWGLFSRRAPRDRRLETRGLPAFIKPAFTKTTSLVSPLFAPPRPPSQTSPPLEREILENQQEITTLTVIWARQLVSPQPKLGPVP